MSSLDKDDLTDVQIGESIDMAVSVMRKFIYNTEERHIKEYVLNTLDEIASDSE